MTEHNDITLNSLDKLVRAGYSIYRIPPAYKKSIHKLKMGKWGIKWVQVFDYPTANETEDKMFELLKDPNALQVK